MLMIEDKFDLIQVIIDILEQVAWPGTILAIIFIFRKKFNSAMDRMGSFEATATGVSMSFEPKLDKAKELFAELKPTDTSKSARRITPEEVPEGSPMSQVMELRDEIIKTIHELAMENGMDTLGRSEASLSAELAKKGVISRENSLLLGTLLELLNAATPTITQGQVDEIRNMYNAI